MSSRSRANRRHGRRGALPDGAEVPVVGPREPCPCGSGKRYKACHGLAAARAATALVRRPFEGLPGECDWVALREVVPAATATVRLAGGAAGEDAGRDVTVATLLPFAAPAIVREDGTVQLGLQTSVSSGDPSRDLAHALERASSADPGTVVGVSDLPGPGPRLQDLLDLEAPFDVEVHDGFGYWADATGVPGAPDVDVDEVLEQASVGLVPTSRLTSVEAAYWCRMGPKEHLRWVLPHDEEAVLDALARLHAAGASTIGAGTRYAGAFRAHGLVVPVWDLPLDTGAEALEEPVAALAARLEETLTDPRPLTSDERRARADLSSRQVTLR